VQGVNQRWRLRKRLDLQQRLAREEHCQIDALGPASQASAIGQMGPSACERTIGQAP
jgi:hypothetical protein